MPPLVTEPQFQPQFRCAVVWSLRCVLHVIRDFRLMSNVLKVVKLQNAKSEFKMLVVLVFCFVAMSFFATGFMYAQASEISILIKLLAIVGAVNIAMMLYILKKFSALVKT